MQFSSSFFFYLVFQSHFIFSFLLYLQHTIAAWSSSNCIWEVLEEEINVSSKIRDISYQYLHCILQQEILFSICPLGIPCLPIGTTKSVIEGSSTFLIYTCFVHFNCVIMERIYFCIFILSLKWIIILSRHADIQMYWIDNDKLHQIKSFFSSLNCIHTVNTLKMTGLGDCSNIF